MFNWLTRRDAPNTADTAAAEHPSSAAATDRTDDDPAYRPRFFAAPDEQPLKTSFVFEPCDESPSDDELTSSAASASAADAVEPHPPPPLPPVAAAADAAGSSSFSEEEEAEAQDSGFFSKLFASVRWLVGVGPPAVAASETESEPTSPRSSSPATEPEIAEKESKAIAECAPVAASASQVEPVARPQSAPATEGAPADSELLQRILHELAQTRDMVSSLAIARGVPLDALPSAAGSAAVFSPPPPPPPPPPSSQSRRAQLDILSDQAEKAQFAQHLREAVSSVLKQAPAIADADGIARRFVEAVKDSDSRFVSALANSYPSVVRRFAGSDPLEAVRRIEKAEKIVFGNVPRGELLEARLKHKREIDRVASESPDDATLEQKCNELVARATKLEGQKLARHNMMDELAQRLKKIKIDSDVDSAGKSS